MNSEGHDHAPRAICFTLSICKYAQYCPQSFSPSSKRLWDSVLVFVSNISILWVFILSMGVSKSFEFIAKSIFLYIEGIFFHPTFVFAETYWSSDLLAVIMLSHVSNWISIWCSISRVCLELGLVDGDDCVWGCGDWVTFVSNVTIMLFSSSRAMVLRLKPSIIAFSSIFLTITCSGDTFSQYRIWSSKDDSRDIAWVLSCPFPSGPFYITWYAYAVSATYFFFLFS